MTQQPDIHAVCLLNHHEAWAALRMIREALEQHCPPGTVPNSEHLEPTFTAEAQALVGAIDELARDYALRHSKSYRSSRAIRWAITQRDADLFSSRRLPSASSGH